VVKLEYGHYQIQDEGFVEWLRQLELEGVDRLIEQARLSEGSGAGDGNRTHTGDASESLTQTVRCECRCQV
jgi:hypothetical protein